MSNETIGKWMVWIGTFLVCYVSSSDFHYCDCIRTLVIF